MAGASVADFVPVDATTNPTRPSARKWFKQWVPSDTVLNPGKCMLLKWVNDDILNSLKDKHSEVVNEPEEEEYEVLYLCTHEGCGKAFSDQTALRKHTNIHGERQFICHYEGCGKRFMDSSKLKRHFLIHTGERPFVCPVDGCGKAFSLDFNLRSHMRTHTQENYHVCPFEDCGKRYAHEYKLRGHLRRFHEKIIPPEVKLAPPPPLPAAFEKEIKTQKTAVVSAASANLNRPFACHHPGCDKRYIHQYKLNLHLRKEHNNTNENDSELNHRTRYDDDMDDGNDKIPKNNGKGKLRMVQKAHVPAKRVKMARPNMTAVGVNMKRQTLKNANRWKEVHKEEFNPDSDESEGEDQNDTEDEEIGRMMHFKKSFDNSDDETDDDMD